MLLNCKTCEDPVTETDEVFVCIACRDTMHWTKTCTGFSESLLSGLSEVRNNILMICNKCSDNGKRDAVVSMVSRQQAALETIKSQIKEAEASLKCKSDKALQKYSDVLLSKLEENSLPLVKHSSPELDLEQTKQVEKERDGIRIHGLPEVGNRVASERFEHDLAEVNKIFAHFGLQCEATDVRRLGKYDPARPRTIIANVEKPCDRRRILLSLPKLKDYPVKLFISRELNEKEYALENLLLKKRREMITNGKDSSCLRIRDLILQERVGNTCEKVDIDQSTLAESS